tara:strand:- start:23743 stop:24153 length:411 start_codon:yes stop_codon:yes gene_type:complete
MILEILLVDDDPVVQYLHKTLLSKFNFPEQKFFSNGEFALDYILENNNQNLLFLILLDINMPVMNGWEFLEELKKHSIKSLVKVVILTSSIDNSDKDKAKSYHQVFEFMEKPLHETFICNLKSDTDLAIFIEKAII